MISLAAVGALIRHRVTVWALAALVAAALIWQGANHLERHAQLKRDLAAERALAAALENQIDELSRLHEDGERRAQALERRLAGVRADLDAARRQVGRAARGRDHEPVSDELRHAITGALSAIAAAAH